MGSGSDFFVGLDLGGSFLKYALGRRDGKLLKKGKMPSKADKSQDDIFNVIFSAISEMQEEAEKLSGTVVGIGLGSPGAIHFKECRLIGSTPNLPEWTNAPIRERIEGETELPIWADNDANIMAFGESRVGAAKGAQDVLCATLGTGIGGGIIINGSVYRGAYYAGAEIGHMMIVHDGIPCNCGGRGCFEKYASAPAMMRRFRDHLKAANKDVIESDSTVDLFRAAQENSPEAIETIKETVGYLGTGFSGLINIFNPEVLVLGGGVAEAGDEFIAQIEADIRERAMEPATRHLKVVRATLGNDAGVYGAITLAAEMYDLQK